MKSAEPAEVEETTTSPVRALFAGHVAEGLVFPYPEIAAEEKETVATFLQSLRDFAADHVDPARIDREHQISQDVIRGLAELGIELPPAPQPVASYVLVKVVGDLAWVAGQVPMHDGAVTVSGSVGSDVTVEEANAGARRCAIQALSALRAAPATGTHGAPAPRAGRIAEIRIVNGAPVEFGQVLAVIE